jgi:hypothetical protein
MLDSTNGRSVRMFERKCGEQTWAEHTRTKTSKFELTHACHFGGTATIYPKIGNIPQCLELLFH